MKRRMMWIAGAVAGLSLLAPVALAEAAPAPVQVGKPACVIVPIGNVGQIQVGYCL